MSYESLTREQQARADALHAAAAAFGTPAEPLDDYLVAAAHWITTGVHAAITDLGKTTSTETHLDGGDVDQGEPISPQQLAQSYVDEGLKADDTPPRPASALQAVQALRGVNIPTGRDRA